MKTNRDALDGLTLNYEAEFRRRRRANVAGALASLALSVAAYTLIDAGKHPYINHIAVNGTAVIGMVCGTLAAFGGRYRENALREGYEAGIRAMSIEAETGETLPTVNELFPYTFDR